MASTLKEKPAALDSATAADESHASSAEVVINASGHVQELERNFGLLSIIGVAVVTGNTWAALAGTITVAIYNGGAPGVIFEFIVVSVMYWFIGASIAELSSAVPSAGGVYHWASLTPAPRYQRICGWFAGWWNFLGWVFGVASLSSVLGNQLVSMYGLFRPEFVPQKWNAFVAYIIMTWLCCFFVLLGNKALPMSNIVGMALSLAGVFISIMVCAIMPSQTGAGYASSDFVWSDYENETGISSPGFVFLAGMLNGAFAVGTTDSVTHMAEEIPNPGRNIPKAIFFQCAIGFFTTLCFLIALFYSVTDLDEIYASVLPFPLAEFYRQATGSAGGALGLLIVIFLPCVSCTIACYLTSGRIYWAMARDEATPFSNIFGKINHTWHNPFNSTVLVGVLSTILGCIQVGSTTAFNAFVGSAVVLLTASYVAAILPHLMTRRSRLVPVSHSIQSFGRVELTIHPPGCAYIIVFIVIFCYPYSMPVTAQNMNYSSVLIGGSTIFIGIWYVIRGRRGYRGPQVLASMAST
ncbi:hypothetical protein A1O1_08021 [Capronia coronata CBS 617.96]|uniref:Choline transporter n=1 Tax=Capronia coronata CBS 617.96 TaxID=1182541 RepID=W9YI40_9EURO|nr:uncharacterized protein A1O1_08021 [Capronia coronata CBS 617.96]EXJ81954.1 hypothetical protein A1O1_08021 [Capronia coronata CBS 617.96]